MSPRYSQKTIFNMSSVRYLDFAKFRSFVKCPSSEWKFASAYHIWSKSDNSRLRLWRYGDEAIFKMAAVRHLEFSKIAILVMWPYLHAILHLCSKLGINLPICRRDTAKIWFSIWRPYAILNLQNFDFFVKGPPSEWKFASEYQTWPKSDNWRLR